MYCLGLMTNIFTLSCYKNRLVTVNDTRYHKICHLIKQLGIINANILCTIKLAISYVSHLILLTLEQYKMIAIAMTRWGVKANEITNLQTPSFKYAFWGAAIA